MRKTQIRPDVRTSSGERRTTEQSCVESDSGAHRAGSGRKAKPALEWPAQEGQKAGRNAGDIDLAFTAGELLHTDDIDCFCIASGDSDFAGLARRLRDAGKTVIGIGEPTKTAKAFREACDRFEKLRKGKAKGAESPTQPKPKKAKGTSTQPDKTAKVGAGKRKEFLKLVRAATAEERGQWLLATWLGDRLRTLKPGFRNEDFGAKRLSTLLKAYPAQIELRPGPKGAEFRMRGQSAEKASTTHNDGPTKAEAKVDVDRDERLSGGKAQQGRRNGPCGHGLRHGRRGEPVARKAARRSRKPRARGVGRHRPGGRGRGNTDEGMGERSRTDDRRTLREAVAHVNSDRVEAAYRRSDLFDRRRVLMNDWAAYVA